MSRPSFRALVLCAGFGTRLRPLTWALPKPLLPIADQSVVGNTLSQLQAAGCQAAVINLHHLSLDLPAALGRQYRGLALEYSFEEEIQGTFGALYPPKELLKDCDAVVLINGDSYCRWPLHKILAHHFRRRADATLLLLPRAPETALGGGIAVDENGTVVQMRDLEKVGREVKSRHGFAGLHVLSPKLLDRVEARFGDIIEDLYQPLLREGGRIESRILSRRQIWHDLGTPARYRAAVLEALNRSPGNIIRRLMATSRRRVFISPLAVIEDEVSIDHSHVERGVRIGRGVSIQDSIILEGAKIGDGCRIRSSIVGPEATLPPASEVEDRMMTRYDKRHELVSNESQMGDLVYTPL